MTQFIQKLINLTPSPRDLGRIEDIAVRLEESGPLEILRWAFNEYQNRVTIATGFGAEGVALIDMATKINPDPDIFFLDTGFLFPETYQLRRRLEDHYRIRIRAFQTALTVEDQEQVYGPNLWSIDPDLCCRLRKVEPLKEALRPYEAWITAIRRDQTMARATARVVEWDYQWKLVKINPLARWTRRDVWSYINAYSVPYNPLHDQGYPSIGCTH